MDFAHLHVHTHYSILDAHSLISDLFERAEELQMPAIAITDHGNLYGAKEFFNCAKKHPTVKPIIGCEVYVSRVTIENTRSRSIIWCFWPRTILAIRT